MDVQRRIDALKDCQWTPEMVVDRLTEAYDVLRRTPMRIGPKEPGGSWPAVGFGVEDIDYASVLLLNRTQKMSKKAKAEAIRQLKEAEAAAEAVIDAKTSDQREEADRPPMPTASETSRAEEALYWPLRFLATHPLEADALGLYARCNALNVPLARALRARCTMADDAVEARRQEMRLEERRDRIIQPGAGGD